ncbi:MAG: alkaline phosphatase D family protein [Actinomycetes bacterium]
MATSFDRRAFLTRAGLAGAGALTAVGVARPPARADEALAPFEHGVASGDPLADRVVIWTRITPAGAGPVDVDWVVASDVDLTDVVASGTVTTGADRDHTVKVDVTGLRGGTTYFYGFTAPDGRRSLTGRTRTLPAPGTAVERFRAAVVSCSNYTGGFFNAYAIAAAKRIDVVLHLGDYIYEYGNDADRYGPEELAGVRDHVPAVEMATLADYRARYANYRLDPDLRRLHQLHPWICVWDDHESTNDSWRDGAENHGDGDVPGDAQEWSVRKAQVQQAYSEWLPIRTDDPARIFRSFPVGDLADLVMLDTRLEGRDEQTGEILEPTLFTSEIDDPERELISEAQRTWLYGQLTASRSRGATWRILGQQVMLMQWNAVGLPEGFGGQDAPSFGQRSGGNAINPDAWDGYTAERTRLYDHLEANDITDNVVLTGDIHTSWAADLPRDPYDVSAYDPVSGAGSLGVEFVTPSVTSDNFNEILGDLTVGQPLPEGSSRPFELGTMADNPHIKYVDLDRHGLLFLDVTPARVQSDWVFTPSRVEPTTEEVAGPSWRVDVGTDHVVAAEAAVVEPADPAADPSPEPPGPPAAVEEEPDPIDLPSTGGGAATLGLAAVAAAGAVRLRTRRPEPTA